MRAVRNDFMSALYPLGSCLRQVRYSIQHETNLVSRQLARNAADYHRNNIDILPYIKCVSMQTLFNENPCKTLSRLLP
jgi:hypothetical protein